VTLGTFLAAIAFSKSYLCYQKEIHEAKERISSGSKIVDCGPMEYAIDGPDNGPPVLISHGTYGGFDQGLFLGKSLVEHGFQVIAPSRFGYLNSTFPKNASVSSQADAYACLLDSLKIDKVSVLGVSGGASSALKFAHMHPDRCKSLALLVPLLDIKHPDTNKNLRKVPFGAFSLVSLGIFRFNFLYWFFSKFAHNVVVSTVLGTPSHLYKNASQDARDHMDQYVELMNPISYRSLGHTRELQFLKESNDYIQDIRVPTLTLSHADDSYGTYEIAKVLANNISNARFIGYPNGGHMGVGYQQTVFSDIATFFETNGISLGRQIEDIILQALD